jgi:excinuclease ABC subunit C
MVVFKDGQSAKSEYRKFKINVKDTPDDFSMMREMLTRRLTRLAPHENAWPTPDLLIIDGGKGQLGVAVEVLDQKGLRIPVVGLAKRIEEIFKPHDSTPIILEHSNPILQLLQRLRDEAHRFAITFHRARRSKAAMKSALDTIAGVGPKTKKLLKQKFGTVANIKAASLDELTAIIGKDKAAKLKKFL